MSEPVAQTLETPKDLGTDSAAEARRWKLEIKLADKRESAWRKKAKDIYRIYAPSLRVVSSAQPTQPTPGSSPSTYTNTTGGPITVYVAGGTVSSITIARQGTAMTTGMTSGAFRLQQNDSIVVTHSSTPTFTVMPD